MVEQESDRSRELAGRIVVHSLSSARLGRYANILVILSRIRRLVRPFRLRFTTSPPSSLPISTSCACLASSAPSDASSRSRQPLAYDSLYRAKRPNTGSVDEKKDTKSKMMEQPTSVTAGLVSALDVSGWNSSPVLNVVGGESVLDTAEQDLVEYPLRSADRFPSRSQSTHCAECEYRSREYRAVLKPPAFDLLVCVIIPPPDVQANGYDRQH